jgi:hypothetical protein
LKYGFIGDNDKPGEDKNDGIADGDGNNELKANGGAPGEEANEGRRGEGGPASEKGDGEKNDWKADGGRSVGGEPNEKADCANNDERGDCGKPGGDRPPFNGNGGPNDERSELYGVGLIGQRSDVGGSKSQGKRSNEGAAHWFFTIRQNGWQGRTGGASYRVGHGGKSNGQSKRRNERVQTGFVGVDGPSITLKTCAICHRSKWPNEFGNEYRACGTAPQISEKSGYCGSSKV